MNLFKNTSASFQQLPKEVKHFLLKGLAVFISWKLIYILILTPKEIPDQWLVIKLGQGTAATLNWFYNTNEFRETHTTKLKLYGNDYAQVTNSFIYRGNKVAIIGIYKSCDGLELMVLASGFILCFYGSWFRKLLFIFYITVGLFLLNLLRCFVLAIIHINWPQHFEFAHKYVFNIIVYGFTFGFFMLYVSNAELKNKNQ